MQSKNGMGIYILWKMGGEDGSFAFGANKVSPTLLRVFIGYDLAEGIETVILNKEDAITYLKNLRTTTKRNLSLDNFTFSIYDTNKGKVFRTNRAASLLQDCNEFCEELPVIVTYNGIDVECTKREATAFNLKQKDK